MDIKEILSSAINFDVTKMEGFYGVIIAAVTICAGMLIVIGSNFTEELLMKREEKQRNISFKLIIFLIIFLPVNYVLFIIDDEIANIIKIAVVLVSMSIGFYNKRKEKSIRKYAEEDADIIKLSVYYKEKKEENFLYTVVILMSWLALYIQACMPFVKESICIIVVSVIEVFIICLAFPEVLKPKSNIYFIKDNEKIYIYKRIDKKKFLCGNRPQISDAEKYIFINYKELKEKEIRHDLYKKLTKEQKENLIKKYKEKRKCKKNADDVKKNNNTIERVILVFIISLLTFSAVDFNVYIYLAITISIWILLNIQYPRKKNLDFYWEISFAFISNLLVFFTTKYFKGHYFQWNIKQIFCIIYAVTLSINVLALLRKRIEKKKNRSIQKLEEKKLFRERYFDLERLMDYLKIFSIIGVNGAWGSGKSFLVDQLERKEYIFVKIDLLACNLDEIQTVLLNELDSTLKAEGIFSPFSPKLKKILEKDNWIRDIGQIFLQDNTTYSEALGGFSTDLKKLQKKLLIIFEDLDRIDNINVVRKVLGIAEKIAGENIKVIYQYDEKNLFQKDGLDRNYIEKYIPATVNLTEIPFSHLLSYIFEEKDDNGLLKNEDFEFLQLPIFPLIFSGSGLELSPFNLQISGVTIRKMEQFFTEIKIYTAKENSIYVNHKREVILFFMIKHFYNDIYEQLIPGKSLSDIFTFDYYDEKNSKKLTGTIDYWFSYCREKDVEINFNSIFYKEENYKSAMMLSLFQYQCDTYEVESKLEEFVNEPISNIQKKEQNEQVDRIIWNLLCNGKSEYTNQRMIIEMLQKEVLSKNQEDQKSAFEKFWKKIFEKDYKETEKNDNRTIFRLGIPSMVSLFQANCVVTIDTEQWKKFLDFYFQYNKINSIVPEVIECLNYCKLSDHKVYLHVLKKFVSLDVERNVNHHKSYRTFLDLYLTALSGFGYVNTGEVSIIRYWDENKKLEVDTIEKKVFCSLKENLQKLEEKIPIELRKIKDDIKLTIKFIEKNEELMNADMKFGLPRATIKSKFEISEQKEVDDFVKKGVSDVRFYNDVLEKYETGELAAYQVPELWRKRRNASDREAR